MTPVFKAGDVLQLGRDASPQFAANTITVRVIRVLDRPTYEGWKWIDVYQLDAGGDATARRELYVMPAGARIIEPPTRVPGRRKPIRRSAVLVGR